MGGLYRALLVAVVGLAGLPAARGAAGVSPSPAEQRLHQAIQQADALLLKSAIAEGADANCRGTNGLPPLLELLAAAAGPLDDEHRHCVACLLENQATVSVTDSDRRTPLIYAARLGDLETIRLLVEAEAYVMTRDRFGKSALFYAVEAGRRDIALYLATNGDLISLSVKERKAFATSSPTPAAAGSSGAATAPAPQSSRPLKGPAAPQ
jgi:ankyrin repeat protein